MDERVNIHTSKNNYIVLHTSILTLLYKTCDKTFEVNENQAFLIRECSLAMLPLVYHSTLYNLCC